MRFISKYAKYKAYARQQMTEAYASGGTRIVQDQLLAEFSIGEVRGDERATARQMFRFNGFMQEADLVSIVEPDYRISAFDSRKAQVEKGWTDEEREMIEARLLTLIAENPGELLLVEEIRLSPPWPTYDTYSGTRNTLLKKIAEDGYDVADVLAYERENQNRDEVISILESALDHEDELAPVGEEELVG